MCCLFIRYIARPISSSCHQHYGAHNDIMATIYTITTKYDDDIYRVSRSALLYHMIIYLLDKSIMNQIILDMAQ